MEEKMRARRANILDFVNHKDYKPMKRKELAAFFQVPAADRDAFETLLDEMLAAGDLVETGKGKLMTPKALALKVGTFLGHPKGFGFVATEDPEEKDLFISADHVNGAMHKDRVLVRLLQEATERRGGEGEIVRVLSRGVGKVVGVYQGQKGYGFVEADDKKLAQDILIPAADGMGAVTGQKVVVEITRYPENGKGPVGRVVEILGHINDPGVDILSVVRQFDLPVDFPEEVYRQIADVPLTLSEADLSGREDLRDWTLVTIDGEDAKDLDDAVSIETLPNGGFRLGVHIADVSHYVREHTPLDQEALRRGTSVYLVDRVIPMLPHKLSNGICSLNPLEDRLALSCIMDLDGGGNVTASRVAETVIHSSARMTYTAVKEILEDQNPETTARYRELVPMFQTMKELRDILLQKRIRRGAVNFDLPEAKVILDEAGKPVDIRPYDRNVATSIIEEFMLICNETVAETFYWQELPFVYRSHEAPETEKAEKMLDFIGRFGYRMKGKGEIRPQMVAELLEQVKGKPEERVISRMVLRSMMQAKYQPENDGHFGLAAKYYCHFTSPIRRYPDLQIHRIIKESLHGGLTEKRARAYEKRLPAVAEQCSLRERVADDAERETVNLKKAEFMEDKIGMEYPGVISGVTNWGVYVELQNTVEGMVSLGSLTDDHYLFDEKNMRVIGERTRRIYQLGDQVNVRVTRADKQLRTIDFMFV